MNFGQSTYCEFCRIKWLLEGIRQCNRQLKVNSTINEISLGAVTRIDISHNILKTLPDELFQMCSLRWAGAIDEVTEMELWNGFSFRYLNIAQNKLESLPSAESCKYRCPMLEELYLQDNNLEDIPGAIFRMPSLVILDISNNKLQRIPFDMWKAPKLRELNIAFNLLKDLPSAREVNIWLQILSVWLFSNELLFRRAQQCCLSTPPPTPTLWWPHEECKYFNDCILYAQSRNVNCELWFCRKNTLIHPNIWSRR